MLASELREILIIGFEIKGIMGVGLAFEKKIAIFQLVAAAASEPEANERGSSLIDRRLLYRSLKSLFLTKREELWLCTNGGFRIRSGIPRDCGYA